MRFTFELKLSGSSTFVGSADSLSDENARKIAATMWPGTIIASDAMVGGILYRLDGDRFVRSAWPDKDEIRKRGPVRARKAEPIDCELSAAAEKMLQWFFGPGAVSIGSGGGSSIGAQLERAELYARWIVVCSQCGGSGFTKSDGTCGKCKGSGMVGTKRAPTRTGDAVFQTQMCRTCRGCGHDRKTGDVCGRCDGDGYLRRPIMALNETHQTAELDTHEMEEYGHISNVLALVRATDPGAYRTLSHYCGPDGSRWEGRPTGRIFALYPLTDSGRRLVAKHRASKADARCGFDDMAILAEEMDLEGVTPDPERKALLSSARNEATVLLDVAKAAWRATPAAREFEGEIAAKQMRRRAA